MLLQPLPSEFLPSLQLRPSPLVLSAPLDHLEALFEPPRVVSLLEDDSRDADAPEPLDDFERKVAVGWVERVVALGAREMSNGNEGWEDTVSRAARLCATLAGHCCKSLSFATL